MNKITIKIDGMMCAMCEAHICDTIRKTFPKAKHLKASKTKGEATFIYESPVDEEIIKNSIEETGYKFISFSTEPYKKRRFFKK